MPGPVSDSYDPEWGTRANAGDIQEELSHVYNLVSDVLGGSKPIYILDLVQEDLPNQLTATLTEKEWRIIRFALERASESV